MSAHKVPHRSFSAWQVGLRIYRFIRMARITNPKLPRFIKLDAHYPCLWPVGDKKLRFVNPPQPPTQTQADVEVKWAFFWAFSRPWITVWFSHIKMLRKVVAKGSSRGKNSKKKSFFFAIGELFLSPKPSKMVFQMLFFFFKCFFYLYLTLFEQTFFARFSHQLYRASSSRTGSERRR